MSVLKYIEEEKIYNDKHELFPTYNNNKIENNRKVFYSKPSGNINNLPVLIWFNTDPKNICYYNTEWWLNDTNFNNCNSNKHSKYGGYWLLDLYKKLEDKVIMIFMNPSSNDNWDFNDSSWPKSDTEKFGYPDPTHDKDFIKKVIEKFFNSPYNFNSENVFFGGWSVGCQMVSRMFQVVKVEEDILEPIKSIKGGIMLSGGTYHCYEGYGGGDPIGSCKNCDGNCEDNFPTCCAYCCPKGVTESYYDTKEKYKDHPLCFL